MLSLCGCGGSLDQQLQDLPLDLDPTASSGPSLAARLQGLNSKQEVLVEDDESLTLTAVDEKLTSAPYPNRKNPFEFGIEVDFDKESGTNKELNVKLYGFLGTESPKAIISINGHTRSMSAGDTQGAVEVLTISPPEVRIRTDGVTRTWSLFGSANSNAKP